MLTDITIEEEDINTYVGSKKLLMRKISLVYYITIKNNKNEIEIINKKETHNIIEIKQQLKNDNKYIEIEFNERIKNKYETNCANTAFQR